MWTSVARRVARHKLDQNKIRTLKTPLHLLRQTSETTLRFCSRHWGKITESFGHIEEADLTRRLQLLVREYGYDPWMLVNTVFMRVFGEWLLSKGVIDIPAISTMIGDKCPVCMFKIMGLEQLLDRSIDTVRKRGIANRKAST